jgi:hypothetical protein
MSAVSATSEAGCKRNGGFREAEDGKLPWAGMVPIGLFRPVSLVETEPGYGSSRYRLVGSSR